MRNHDIVVVGASAGGVEALLVIVRALPPDLGAPVLIVVHHPAGASALPWILERAGRMPAMHPADGDPLRPGRIYVAPPDHHLLVEGAHVRLSDGPPEHRLRPAIDPLFHSAAESPGWRVAGVILSGTLHDGTQGLSDIVVHGGVAVVQDPRDAQFSEMPRSAIDCVKGALVLPAVEIGPALGRLLSPVGRAGLFDAGVR